MAMGNYCYREAIECPYATSMGDCLDDIADDFGLCEMLGDDMPPKGLSTEERRTIAAHSQKEACAMNNSVLSSGLSALEILTRFRDAHKGDGNRTDTGLAAAALNEMLPKLEKLEHLKIAEYDEKYGSHVYEKVALFDDRRISAAQVFKIAAEGQEYHPLIVFMSKKQYEEVFKNRNWQNNKAASQ